MADVQARWTPRRREPRAAITLIGAFALDIDDVPVALPTSAQRLVGILAMRGRLGRSRLAGMLWPDATEQRALASLRTGIWRVNQAAPGLVVSDHGWVHLGLSPSVDLHDLTACSRAVLDDAAAALAGPACSLAACCTDPGGGELLPDWEDPWLDQERERLRQLSMHVMEAEARYYSGQRRFDLALDLALAALRADELRESAHRLVVEIHLAEGNHAEARRAAEYCRDVLESELGIGPSEELYRLLDGANQTTPPRLARAAARVR